ncbi:hypothetical protein JOQ06_009041 [Pogonophryne albipinna]|uniref:Uncharacterized protein n=1 Tax=Pogonophryne albipinna TaxID=1090488 RepID=A0AAD6BM91_9TELE|nr:hypothetical protein JOQ06_009041 [Pogonophryne albipinna]
MLCVTHDRSCSYRHRLSIPTCWRENKQTFEGVTEVLEVTLTVSVQCVQVYKCKEMSAKGSLTKSLVLTVIRERGSSVLSVYREGRGPGGGRTGAGRGPGGGRHDTPRLAVCHLKFSISSLLQRPPHFSRVPWVCSERAVLIMCSGLSKRSFVLSR